MRVRYLEGAAGAVWVWGEEIIMKADEIRTEEEKPLPVRPIRWNRE